MSETAASTAPVAKTSAHFKRGWLTLNAKFSGMTVALLLGLLFITALLVNDQLTKDLSREVAERGASVARNIAGKALDPLIQNDDLTLVLLTKDSVEEQAAPEAHAGFVDTALGDLKASFLARASAKNEGIARAFILKQLNEEEGGGLKLYADSQGASEASAYSRPSYLAGMDSEPFPVFREGARLYYDISQPVLLEGKKQGEVHLYMRRDLISDAVRIATTRLVAIMLVSLVGGLIGLVLVARILLRPLGYLVRGVNAVASGDFSYQIGIKQGDELGELVETYNSMAKSLKEKEAVQEALAKYTSKDLVNQMLQDKSKLELGGQRVFTTIYFSVVPGLHGLASTMEPEKYVSLVNEYLEVQSEIISKNGGSIDKFIGDEVMALWGLAGQDRKEMAYLAVKTGVEVQASVARLNADRLDRGEDPFEISIGINSGEVVSGNMGSSVKMDYTVLGANVNLAARLGLVAAQGGQTIVSQATSDLVSTRFKFDKLAPVRLKGIKEPVPLFWPRKILK